MRKGTPERHSRDVGGQRFGAGICRQTDGKAVAFWDKRVLGSRWISSLMEKPPWALTVSNSETPRGQSGRLAAGEGEGEFCLKNEEEGCDRDKEPISREGARGCGNRRD